MEGLRCRRDCRVPLGRCSRVAPSRRPGRHPARARGGPGHGGQLRTGPQPDLRRPRPGAAGVHRRGPRAEGAERRHHDLLAHRRLVHAPRLPGRRGRDAFSPAVRAAGLGFTRVRQLGRRWPTGSESDVPSTSPTARASRWARPRRWQAASAPSWCSSTSWRWPAGSDVPPPDSVVEATRQAQAQKLEAMRAGAAQAVDERSRRLSSTVPPRRRSRGAAAALKLDLLVTGTHGRRGFRHLVLGSVAERLVHLAPCSVLVVRASDPGRGAAGARRTASGGPSSAGPPAWPASEAARILAEALRGESIRILAELTDGVGAAPGRVARRRRGGALGRRLVPAPGHPGARRSR